MLVDLMSQTVSFGIQHDIQLRFLGPDDIPEIKRLCVDWFPIDYPDSWYEDITANPKFYSLAATYNTRIIGIVVSEVKPRTKCNREDADLLGNHFASNTQVAYILSLGVVHDFRRNGIASLLLDSLLSYLTSGEYYSCKAVYLHVLTSNTTAIHFYERRKFRMHNYLPYYYSIKGKPMDGYSYVLYINGGQPPWTLIDYVKQFGQLMARFHPCTLPLRLMQAVHGLVQRALHPSTPLTHHQPRLS